MVVSILIGLVLFVNGFLAGWCLDGFEDKDEKVGATIAISIFGLAMVLAYGVGKLAFKIWKWIKSL